MFPAIVLGLLLTAGSCHAQDPPLQAWHRLDYYQPLGRGQFRIGSRLQVRDGYSVIQQLRVSPAVEWPIFTNWSVFGTGRIPLQDFENRRLHGGPRLFGGIQTGWTVAGLATQLRGGVERLFSTGQSDFSRYRARLTLRKQFSSWAPYVSEETMLVRDGFHTARMAAGLRHGLSERWETDLSYQYDLRPIQWGGSRHLLVTRLRFYRNGRN